MNIRTTDRQRAARSGGARLGSVVAGAAILGSVLIAPAAAFAQPFAAPARTVDAASCQIADATLTWGVKESFRSYISGSIANGEWTVSDDMRYETPSFIWDKVTGEVPSTLDAGSIAFTGAVHFTGHEGAMKLDIADPVIEFAGDDTAYLTLAVGSTDTADAGGDAVAEPVRLAKIDLAGAVSSEDTKLAIVDAPARLTSEGAAALNGEYGSYVAGEDLDPIALEATVSGCALGAQTAKPAPDETPTDAATGAADATAPAPVEQTTPASIPWLPIGIGAVALLVIGVTGGMLLAGRGKGSPAAAQGGAAEQAAPAGAPADPAPADSSPADSSPADSSTDPTS